MTIYGIELDRLLGDPEKGLLILEEKPID